MLNTIKNIIFKIVYVLIIIYLLIYIPCLWGHKPLVVISGSMEPTLKVGGILYYHKTDLDNFKPNDILVYKTRCHTISHRVVKKVPDGFITKGDANQNEDIDIVNKNQVIGKGTNWSIPYIGYYADFIYKHKYLLIIAISILMLDYFNDEYKIRKRGGNISYEKK